MKHCSYCGRESDDAAIECYECGTKKFKPVATINEAKELLVQPIPESSLIQTAVPSIGPASFAYLTAILSSFWVSMLAPDFLPHQWGWLLDALFFAYMISGLIVVARKDEWTTKRPRILILPLVAVLIYLVMLGFSHWSFSSAKAYVQHYAVVCPLWFVCVVICYRAWRPKGQRMSAPKSPGERTSKPSRGCSL